MRGTCCAVEAFDARGNVAGEQAGGVDQQARRELHRLGAADAHVEAVARHRRAVERAVKREHRAAVFGVALQREHEGVAVDDAGRGRVQCGDGGERGLHRPRLVAADQPRIGNAIGQRLRMQRFERCDLALLHRHDELAAAPVRHAMRFAIGIQRLAPFDAQPRFQRAARVVQPGVDDLAVARAGARADAFGLVDDDDLMAGLRELARDGQADDARADDEGINAFHERSESQALVAAQVQVHALHRRPARAFAEVVFTRDQDRLRGVGKDEDVDAVACRCCPARRRSSAR